MQAADQTAGDTNEGGSGGRSSRLGKSDDHGSEGGPGKDKDKDNGNDGGGQSDGGNKGGNDGGQSGGGGDKGNGGGQGGGECQPGKHCPATWSSTLGAWRLFLR
jgi:hypothetical protein